MILTLDTNILRDATDTKREAHGQASTIFELGRLGHLQLQVTTRLTNDVPHEPLKSQLNSIPELCKARPGSLWRVGYTAIGSNDGIASEELSDESEAIMQLLFPGASSTGKHHPNRIADIDHLIAHRKSGADFFLTRENAILTHAKVLAGKHGISVKSVQDFLDTYETELRKSE